MTAWIPVGKPTVEVVLTRPTADLVRRSGLSFCPGIRLTKHGLAVKDSEGYFTEFFTGPGGLNYARVLDPQGFYQWLQELRVLPEKGVGTNG